MFQLSQTAAALAAALLVGLPLLTLVHELAHALVGAALVGGRAAVLQGSGPLALRLSLWRVDLRLRGPVPPHRAFVGWAVWGAHEDRRRHAAATAAGPLASAASAGGLGALSACAPAFLQPALLLLAGAGALQAASSAVPLRYGRWFGQYGGEASDGLRLRRLLQGTAEPVPAAALVPPRR